MTTSRLLPAQDHSKVLVGFNPPDSPFPTGTIPQLFEQQVARAPEAVAVQYAGQSLSYAALSARANQLAHRLVALGVTRNTPVAMLLERSLDMMVTLLGIQKSGGYYVPIDPEYPAERIGFLLADCAPKVLVTSAAPLARLGAVSMPVVNFSTDRAALDVLPDTTPEVGLTPDDFIYAIYTSGSTGKPKGALNFQKSEVNLTHWYAGDFGMGPHTAFLVIASISFDQQQKTVLAPLLVGGRVVLLDSPVYDPQLILSRIAEERLGC